MDGLVAYSDSEGGSASEVDESTSPSLAEKMMAATSKAGEGLAAPSPQHISDSAEVAAASAGDEGTSNEGDDEDTGPHASTAAPPPIDGTGGRGTLLLAERFPDFRESEDCGAFRRALSRVVAQGTDITSTIVASVEYGNPEALQWVRRSWRGAAALLAGALTH